MGTIDLVGWCAGALVLATFYLRTMIPLRAVAVVSNIAFVAYGSFTGAIPIIVLHCLLLPLNVVRLREMRSLIKRVKIASHGDLSVAMLVPYMKIRHAPAGTRLFGKGDYAGELLYILKGSVRIENKDVLVQQGQLVGEMGLFSPGQLRTDTAICASDVEYGAVSEERMWELLYQNPQFGAHLLRLVVLRFAGAGPAGPAPTPRAGFAGPRAAPRLSRDDAYLSRSTDHADCERRQRMLDRQHALAWRLLP